jgi:hypothetical protein
MTKNGNRNGGKSRLQRDVGHRGGEEATLDATE